MSFSSWHFNLHCWPDFQDVCWALIQKCHQIDQWIKTSFQKISWQQQLSFSLTWWSLSALSFIVSHHEDEISSVEISSRHSLWSKCLSYWASFRWLNSCCCHQTDFVDQFDFVNKLSNSQRLAHCLCQLLTVFSCWSDHQIAVCFYSCNVKLSLVLECCFVKMKDSSNQGSRVQ